LGKETHAFERKKRSPSPRKGIHKKRNTVVNCQFCLRPLNWENAGKMVRHEGRKEGGERSAPPEIIGPANLPSGRGVCQAQNHHQKRTKRRPRRRETTKFSGHEKKSFLRQKKKIDLFRPERIALTRNSTEAPLFEMVQAQ